MSTPTSIRLDEATAAKLDWLEQLYGSRTKAIAVALDRLYQNEHDRATPPVCEECGEPMEYVAPGRGYYTPTCDH